MLYCDIEIACRISDNLSFGRKITFIKLSGSPYCLMEIRVVSRPKKIPRSFVGSTVSFIVCLVSWIHTLWLTASRGGMYWNVTGLDLA